MAPGQDLNDTCDETEDPEYNFLADDEEDTVDDEDFRDDKAVNIPSTSPLIRCFYAIFNIL